MPDARIGLYTLGVRNLPRTTSDVFSVCAKHPDFFPIITAPVGGEWHSRGRTMSWLLDRRISRRHDVAIPAAPAVPSGCIGRALSKSVGDRQFARKVHDLGFIFLNTYLPWYQLTGDNAIEQVLLQAAATSDAIHEEGVSAIVRRPGIAVHQHYYERADHFLCRSRNGRSRVAVRCHSPLPLHARHNRTPRRFNGSRIFDLETGKFLRQTTHQGLRDDSAWARGLAWSLYGYSKVYGLTGSDEFLDVAERNAKYWLDHLPADRVPYWDFDADLSQPPPWC